MTQPSTNRPKWQIDLKLESLQGQPVRVGVQQVAPPGRTEFVSINQFMLPDGLPPTGRTMAEGRLLSWERQVGVVFVQLGALSGFPDSEGLQFHRGDFITIVRGPLNVQLSAPFFVEPLPEPHDFLRDLRNPRTQFTFPFQESKCSNKTNR